MQPERWRKLTAWWLVIIVMVVIFALSAQPQSAAFTAQIFGEFNHVARKAAHFTEFAVLFIVAWSALRLAFPLRWSYLCGVIALVACVVYAGLDEWHQSFVPGRTASIHDVFIDAAGAATAWGGITILRWLRR